MKILIISDVDLDGFGSLLMLHWLFNKKAGELEYMKCSVANLSEAWDKYFTDVSPKNFTKIFILDLDCTSIIDRCDRSNVVIIDHHNTHFEKKQQYKNAKVHIETYPSNTLYIYKLFKDKLSFLNKNQLNLIKYINDYDCYKLNYPESFKLNALYHNIYKIHNKDNTHQFLEKFYDGFVDFNYYENNIIRFYTEEKTNAIKNAEFYEGRIRFGKDYYDVASVISSNFINELADYILRDLNKKVAIIINAEKKRISVRTRDCDAAYIINEMTGGFGGGHYSAGGGPLNESVVDMTRLLKKIENNA